MIGLDNSLFAAGYAAIQETLKRQEAAPNEEVVHWSWLHGPTRPRRADIHYIENAREDI